VTAGAEVTARTSRQRGSSPLNTQSPERAGSEGWSSSGTGITDRYPQSKMSVSKRQHQGKICHGDIFFSIRVTHSAMAASWGSLIALAIEEAE